MYRYIASDIRIIFDDSENLIHVERDIMAEHGFREQWKKIDSFTESKWDASDFSKIDMSQDIFSEIAYFWLDAQQTQTS